MKIAKNIVRWLLILACLGAVFSCGLFSVSGIMALAILVLALPIHPATVLWGKLLPPDSPRFARSAILGAAFLVVLAAAPWTGEKKSTVPTAETTAVSTSSATTATLEPTSAPTPLPAPEKTPEPTPRPSETPLTDSPLPVAETAEEEELSSAAEENPGSAADTAPQENRVYVAGSGNGKRYHRDPTCSSMKDPVELTQEEAEARGYTPCKRCYQ